MKHLKKFNESSHSEVNEELKESFSQFSKNLGIDEIWLAEYLQECFEYYLDRNDMPFSEDEFENILDKIESLK